MVSNRCIYKNITADHLGKIHLDWSIYRGDHQCVKDAPYALGNRSGADNWQSRRSTANDVEGLPLIENAAHARMWAIMHWGNQRR